MQDSNGPGPVSFGLGVLLAAIVFLLHQAPRSVVTVYVASSGHASTTHIQASTILLPVATSLSTILLIAYLLYLGISLRGARTHATRTSVERLDAVLAAAPVMPSPELAAVPLSMLRES
ncbi:MAG TPA: hypothetical protein VF898_12310 [Chloroflexota bacterium]